MKGLVMPKNILELYEDYKSRTNPVTRCVLRNSIKTRINRNNWHHIYFYLGIEYND